MIVQPHFITGSAAALLHAGVPYHVGLTVVRRAQCSTLDCVFRPNEDQRIESYDVTTPHFSPPMMKPFNVNNGLCRNGRFRNGLLRPGNIGECF